MGRIALIDADSIIHIVSYHYQISKFMLEDLDINADTYWETVQELYNTLDRNAVLAHVDSFINDILTKTDSTHYLGFVGTRTGSDTFRHKLAKTKPYKGNRKSSPHWVSFWKPIIIEHMISVWKFIELSNIEADDACAICQTHLTDTIICSPDKDLKQVPGDHYDYKKCEFSHITYEDSIRILYSQVLIGDSTDNISGCPGIGDKSKFLEFPDCTTPEDYHKFVFDVFSKKGVPDMMEEQLALVYMLRDVDGIDLKEVPTPVERSCFGIQTDSIEQEDEVIDFANIENVNFTQN